MNQRGSGIGFVGLLTIVLITVKLLGLTDVSWWWVLSPLWISTGIVVLIVLAFAAFIIIQSVWEVHSENKKIKGKRRR